MKVDTYSNRKKDLKMQPKRKETKFIRYKNEKLIEKQLNYGKD